MIHEVHNYQAVYDDFGGSTDPIYVTYRDGGGEFQALFVFPGDAISFQAVVGTVTFYPTPSEFAVSDIGDTGLTWDDSPVVYSPLDVDVTPTDVTAPGGNDGAIALVVSGGSGNYSFLWADGPVTQNRAGLLAGIYTVTVTDTTTGLTNVNVIEIADGVPPTYPPLNVTSDVDDVTTNGGNDGAIDISVSGGSGVFTYAWSNGAVTQDVAALIAGDYTVTVTDTTTGFTIVKNFHVSEPDALLFDAIDVVLDTLTPVSVSGGSDGAISITVSGGSGSFSYFWNNGATTQDIAALPAGVYSLTILDTITTLTKTVFFTVVGPAPLAVVKSSTNCTAAGANDGSITLVVSGGSGDYSFVWGDGPVTQNRIGLPPGVYNVTVTDDVTGEEITIILITITEPAIDYPDDPDVSTPHIGSILTVPFLNSLQFVTRGNAAVQGLDNQLFCEQVFKGHDDSPYYQKVQKADNIIVQFNSDFDNHLLQLRDVFTDEVVKTFDCLLKEQNIDKVEDFGISLRNHTIFGKSRVYFNAGTPPIPLSVGNVFEILNNLDGFDGVYSIVDIVNDPLLGYAYLVINREYDIVATSSLATGRFVNNSDEFNVYESTISLADVEEGKYYFHLRGYSDNEKICESEPIDLKTTHEGTTLITYRNTDNAFDITWSTGYIGNLRVESLFGHKRFPGGERTLSRNSDFSLVKVSSRKQRILLYEFFSIPPWLVEKLSVVFDCDTFFINSIQCQASEGLSEPAYLDRDLLSNCSIKVEQLNWFRKFNSNDIESGVNNVETMACIDIVIIDTTVNPIICNFAGGKERVFKGSADINADKALLFVNNGSAIRKHIRVNIATALVKFEFPSNYKMAQAGWDDATHQFEFSDIGEWEIFGTFDGVIWTLKAFGKF